MNDTTIGVITTILQFASALLLLFVATSRINEILRTIDEPIRSDGEAQPSMEISSRKEFLVKLLTYVAIIVTLFSLFRNLVVEEPVTTMRVLEISVSVAIIFSIFLAMAIVAILQHVRKSKRENSELFKDILEILYKHEIKLPKKKK